MTDVSTAAVERLMDGVTEGPWNIDRANVLFNGSPEMGSRSDLAKVIYHDEDVRFIAAARELVPALAADRDRWQARAEALEAALVAIQQMPAFNRTDVVRIIDAALGGDTQ